MLHVGDGVVLVDNLHAQDGFHDVFQRDDALKAAVVVNDAGNLVLGFEEAFPDVRHGGFLMEGGNFPFDTAKAHVKLVFRQVFQHVVTEDVAGDEFR